MKTKELMALVPDSGAVVLLQFPWGGVRAPDTVTDLIGTSPMDAIIEQKASGSPVIRANTFREYLAECDPEGDAQMYISLEGRDNYYDVGRIKANNKVVRIYAGAWRCGG